MIGRAIDAIGGRKFAASLLALALGTAVELTKEGGLGEAYVMLLVGVVGVFSGANALVTWRGMTVGEPASPQQQQPASLLEEQVNDFLSKVNIAEMREEIDALKKEQAVQAEALSKATKLIGELIARAGQQ